MASCSEVSQNHRFLFCFFGRAADKYSSAKIIHQYVTDLQHQNSATWGRKKPRGIAPAGFQFMMLCLEAGDQKV
jgi:hypothetical protein